MKYEEKINWDYNNTMTLFASEIKSNTIILEFGPASGRLTEYLKNEKECDVYIVEIDSEAGQVAQNFAKSSLIGEEGNIENFIWYERYRDIKFDYILFADVLEHLNIPCEVLKKSSELLKSDGRILLSVPNIAHNSVIIDLINNKFEYKKTGILDDTHLKFWTLESIEDMVEKAGLFVVKKSATYTQVGLNEFDNKYSDCDGNLEFFLKTRPYNEVYQYVFMLGKKNEGACIDDIRKYSDYYYVQWIDEINNSLDVENAERIYITFENNKAIYVHDIGVNTTRVRFDPINKCECCVKINQVLGYSKDDKKIELFYEVNGVYRNDSVVIFDDVDPQIMISVSDDDICRVEVDLEYVSVNDDRYNSIFRNVALAEKVLNDTIQLKENYIEEQKNLINEKENIILKNDKVIEEKNQIIIEKDNVITEKNNVITEKDNVITEKDNAITEKDKNICDLNTEIARLTNIINQQSDLLIDADIKYNELNRKAHEYEDFLVKRGVGRTYKIYREHVEKESAKQHDILKIAILNPYVATLGGGEKHMGYLCQFLEEYYSNRNVQIDILVHDYNDVHVHDENYITMNDINKQFGLNLVKTQLRKLDLPVPNMAHEIVEQRYMLENVTAEYDIFINFMFQSKHISKAKYSIYECMFPPVPMGPLFRNDLQYLQREEKHDKDFIDSYDLFITNSEYTDYWTDYRWDTLGKQLVIYPPVFSLDEIEGKYDESKKKNIIISVGRFFVGSHSKKQLDLVKFFVNNQDVFKDYEYHLCGAVATLGADREYLEEIKSVASKVNNVFIHENCPFDELMELYSQAKIFWHATGYGVNENKEPEKMEHFGITPVEAMSYGAIPVVINKGGPRETVEEGINGFRWNTEAECVEKTKKIIEDDELRRKMAVICAEKAKSYSIEKFYERHKRVFDEIHV